MKYYSQIIKDPCDSYTYKIEGFALPENSEIFIKYIGGSDEKCEYKYYDGILEVTTPIFAINPIVVLIGYEK